MKLLTIFLTILFVLGFVVACNGQPNTQTTFEVGIVNPQPEKTYLFFAEVKQDTSISQLVDGMDYLSPDVSGLVRSLANVHTVGDTLFGEIEFPDRTYPQFLKGGLVQVNNISLKYSAMKVSNWLALDMVESMQAGFFVRKKKQ